jgi:hypothetical protein
MRVWSDHVTLPPHTDNSVRYIDNRNVSFRLEFYFRPGPLGDPAVASDFQLHVIPFSRSVKMGTFTGCGGDGKLNGLMKG